MQSIDLAHALTLAPVDAIKYFRSKGQKITWDWWEMWEEAHHKAFTVAKAADLALLQTLREEVGAALAEGYTAAEFRKRLEPRLRSRGWWGKEIDPKTGKVIQLGSPARLNTIYRTNMQSAYNAGRYKSQMDNADNRPYLQYVAIIDDSTRDSHAALNGMVFPASDPFWSSHTPPLGFNCRCRTRALTARQVERRGITVNTGKGNMDKQAVKVGSDAYGNPVERKVSVYNGIDKNGKQISIATDPGFSSKPTDIWKPDLSRYDPDLAGAFSRATQ